MIRALSTIKTMAVTVTVLAASLGIQATWAPPAGANGTWTTTGDLVRERTGGGGALLQDGRFFVVGGWNQGSKTAEIYDPVSGTWQSTTAPTQTYSQRQTSATRLDDGRVLAVTGSTTAELYDPQADTWTSTGPLAVQHRSHTATELQDGRVLVVGNSTTAEIYDPSSNTWSATGPMSQARQNHAAVALNDGRVLVTGGDNTGTAEIYSPADNAWEPVEAMGAPRGYHASALLPDGTVLVAGGTSSSVARRSAEIFDPLLGEWSETAQLASGRYFSPPAVLPDGRVMLAGGYANNSVTLASAEIYDPAAGTWSSAGAAMSSASGEHFAATLQDGKVLIAGGSYQKKSELYDPAPRVIPQVPEVSAIDPSEAVSAKRPPVTITGSGFTRVTNVEFGGLRAPFNVESPTEITALPPPQPGGTQAHVTVSNAAGSSVPGAGTLFTYLGAGGGTWRHTGVMNHARGQHTAALLSNGRVLTAGGQSLSGWGFAIDGRKRAEVFDAAALDTDLGRPGTWLPTGTMTTGRAGAALVALPGGRALVAGGSESGFRAIVASAEVFEPNLVDPVTGLRGVWLPAAPMGVPRIWPTATLLDGPPCRTSNPPSYCGKVLVAGGGAGVLFGVAQPTAELFDPSTGTWSPAPPMSELRAGHNAILLDGERCHRESPPNYCGKVLVVGGGTAVAELYDPAANNGLGGWISAGSTAVSRGGFTTGDSGFSAATQLADGRVLLTGGWVAPDIFTPIFTDTDTAEIYDPRTNTWTTTGPMTVSRTGHTSALLANGNVLVAGGMSFGNPLRTAEIFDPAADDGRGTFTVAQPMTVDRSQARSIAIPTGPESLCGINCGKVLMFGGLSERGYLPTSELFAPLPEIRSVTPAGGSEKGGTEVVISGTGLASVSSVRFGEYEARSFRVDPQTPDTAIRAVAPRGEAGTVPVGVTTDGGVSLEAPGAVFTYGLDGLAPGGVADLSATPTSGSGAELTFSAIGSDGDNGPPVEDYIVRMTQTSLSEPGDFEAAQPLCDGPCHFGPATVGDKLTLAVTDLLPETTYHFALKPTDDAGNAGPISNVASITTLSVAPNPVVDLAARPLSARKIELSFSAPGSDAGAPPPAGNFQIKQSMEPIEDEADFEGARALCSELCTFAPRAVGDPLRFVVTDLEPGTTYHYALKPTDQDNNLGPLSDSVQATTPLDGVGPAGVTDLSARPLSQRSVELTFSAPGSDGADPPPADSYIIKQSRRAIADAAAFEDARSLCPKTCNFAPRRVGDQLRFVVTDLTPKTTYHYSVRAIDQDGNLGPISSSVRVKTAKDRIRPAAVDDLAVRVLSSRKVKLTFSAPGSDGANPPPVGTFVIRQSERPIVGAKGFRSARRLCGRLCSFQPQLVSERITLEVDHLEPGTRYRYAVRAKDASGNYSKISNVVTVRTSRQKKG